MRYFDTIGEEKMTSGQTLAEHSLYHVWLGATDDDDAGRDYLARMTGQEAAQLEQCAGDHEIWSSVERLDVSDQSILDDCTVADCEFSYADMVAAVRDTATLLDPDDASTRAMNIFRELLQEHGVDLDREGVAIHVSVKHEDSSFRSAAPVGRQISRRISEESIEAPTPISHGHDE
jgi:hypothetical protein